MRIILFVLLLGLTGCTFHFDNWAIQQASNYCKDNEGIDYINVQGYIVTCNNGKVFNLTRNQIK